MYSEKKVYRLAESRRAFLKLFMLSVALIIAVMVPSIIYAVEATATGLSRENLWILVIEGLNALKVGLTLRTWLIIGISASSFSVIGATILSAFLSEAKRILGREKFKEFKKGKDRYDSLEQWWNEE